MIQEANMLGEEARISQAGTNITDTIRANGGTSKDISTWLIALEQLRGFCDIRHGITDDYTIDILTCWIGWVMHAPFETTKRIIEAANDIIVTPLDDKRGEEGSKIMLKAIYENAEEEAANAVRQIAIDELQRMRTDELGTAREQ